jgi:hypothetical protein
MKNLFIATFLLIPTLSSAQALKIDLDRAALGPKLPYCLIDTIVKSDYTGKQLYSNALSFLTTPHDQLQVEVLQKDIELGEVTFKASSYKPVEEDFVSKKNKHEYATIKYKVFFTCRLILKDNKFKVLMSSLEYPSLPQFDMEGKFPVHPVYRDESNEVINSKQNNIANDLAINFIKEIASKINKKPENDF